MTLYYRVGGAGNWNDPAKWSLSSGGAGGAGFPATNDTFVTDALSSPVDYTITANVQFIGSGVFGAPATGVLTLLKTINLQIIGSIITCHAGMIHAGATQISFGGSSGGTLDITSNGVTWVASSIVVGTNTVRLLDNFTQTGSGVAGGGLFLYTTLNCNGFNFSTDGPIFGAAASGPTLIGGSGVITCASFGGRFNLNFPISFTANTSTVVINNIYVPRYRAGTAANFFPAPAAATAYTFYNLTITTTTDGAYADFLVTGITVTNNFLCNGAVDKRILLSYSGHGEGRTTITCNGTVSMSYTDCESIAGAGSASWAGGTSIGDGGNNTGITFTAPVTRYYVGGTGDITSTAMWSASSGGATGETMPLIQDSIVFDGSSFPAGGTLTVPAGRNPRFGALDFTGAGLAFALSLGLDAHLFLYGSFTLKTGMTTLSGGTTSGFVLCGQGQFTFTSNSVSINENVHVDCSLDVNTKWSLNGALVVAFRHFTVGRGRFYTNDFALTVGVTLANNGNIRSGLWQVFFGFYAGTSTITATSTAGLTQVAFLTAIVDGPGVDVHFERATLVLNYPSGSGANTVAYAGIKNYIGTLRIQGVGTQSVVFTGNPVIKRFICATGPRTISITAGTTVTILDRLILLGSAGNLITWTSVTAAVHFLRGSGKVQRYIKYANFSYCTAVTPGFYAENSTDSGNNRNITFGAAPEGYGRLGAAALAATTETDVYTVPAGCTTDVSSIVVANRGAAPTTFRLSIAATGAATANKDYLYYDVTIQGNETFASTRPILLPAGAKLRAYAGNANLTCQVYGNEQLEDSP